MKALKAGAKRFILWGVMPKVALTIACIALGVINGSILATTVTVAFAIWFIRKGVREQVWIDPHAQAARIWEDLVWGHSTWLNPNETPEQGIERLAGPHQRLVRRPPEQRKRSSPRISMPRRQVQRADTGPCRYCARGVARCDGHGVRELSQ
jgi:hypothetical protein